MPSSTAELARRLLQRASGDSPQPAVIQAVLQILEEQPGEELIQEILAGLRLVLDRPLVRDAAWETWHTGRHPLLFALLQECALPASKSSPAGVISHLALDLLAGLGEDPQEVESLLVACSDADAMIAKRAESALRGLENPAARSELCRWVIQSDHPTARAIALDCGYTPLDAPSRALFFLLTEQWDRYQALDFDAGLLEAVYAAGSDALRSQIAALARQTGLASFARIMTGSRLRRISSGLSDFEWEAVQVILSRQGRFADMWRLAQNAPPVWSARLLNSLRSAGWQNPGSADQASYLSLVQAASNCPVDLPSEIGGVLTEHSASLHGHSRQITSLCNLPAHQLLASASAEKTVRLWNIAADRLVTILEGHTDFVLALAGDPDFTWIASGGADRSVRIWSLPEGRLKHVLGGHAGRVSHMTTSPDGRLLFSGDERAIHIWDTTASFRQLSVIKNLVIGLNQLAVFTTGSAPEGFLIAGDADRTVRIWSIPTPENPATELRRTLLTPIVGWALGPAFDASNRLLASSSSYGAVQLWRIPDGEVVRSLPGRANTNQLAFSPDGRWLAAATTVSGRSGVLLWDLNLDDAAQPAFLPGGAGLTSALAFHPSSSLLAVASQDRTLRLWAVPPGGEPPSPLKILEGHNTPVRHLLFPQAGGTLFSADELTIHRWSIDLISDLLAAPIDGLQPEKLAILLLNPDLTADQRAWLAFSLELARHQRSFDIEIGEVEILSIGDYDIELE